MQKKVKKLKIKDLNKKNLLSNKIGVEASIIAKKSIRDLIHKFQLKLAYSPPKNILDLVLMEEILLIILSLMPTSNFLLRLISKQEPKEDIKS